MANDTYITLEQAADSFPGKPSHRSVWVWARKGLRVVNSASRIHLKHVRQGNRLFTTVAWVNEFMVTLAQSDIDNFDRELDRRYRRSPRERDEASYQAEQRILARKSHHSSHHAPARHAKGGSQHV